MVWNSEYTICVGRILTTKINECYFCYRLHSTICAGWHKSYTSIKYESHRFVAATTQYEWWNCKCSLVHSCNIIMHAISYILSKSLCECVRTSVRAFPLLLLSGCFYLHWIIDMLLSMGKKFHEINQWKNVCKMLMLYDILVFVV